jgi:ribosomal protein L11 methyltransferase
VAGTVELGLGGFGNGEHPTTRMLIEQLSRRITGGERVLDVGCGSGVLGLCALQLGASCVVAVDNQADSVEATRRNAALNAMDDRMRATLAPLVELDDSFDVILANIGRGAMVELAPELVRLLSRNGWLGASGFSPPQCSLVAGHLRPLVELERQTDGEWSALFVARRRSPTAECS